MSLVYRNIEEKDYIGDDINEYKCCETPFPIRHQQYTRCNICNLKYNSYKIMVYDCKECNKKECETTKALDLIKDSKTNWTSCDGCNKDVEYRYIKKNSKGSSQK